MSIIQSSYKTDTKQYWLLNRPLCCYSNPAGTSESTLWDRVAVPGEAEGPRGAGRAALSRGCAGRKRCRCSRAGEIPPREPRGGKSVTWRRRTVKQGRRGKSLPLSLLFCKRSTSCFPPNSSSITFREDHTLQTFFYYMYVCVYILCYCYYW